MLIYNFQKEFIGIDAADLEVFGFTNLSELKAESSDFADMFVRTPGYIHNFKHVHWIDFVTCADPSEQSKVIIEVNSKTYKAVLDIETVYLSDNPTSKAYLIYLNSLRGLTLQENGEFSEDIARKKPPKIEPTVGHAFNLSQKEVAEIEEVPELEGFKPFENLQDTPEVQEEVAEIQEENFEIQEHVPTAPLDISFDDDEIDESIFDKSEAEPIAVETPTVVEAAEAEENFSVDSFNLDLDDLVSEEDEKLQEKTHAVEVEEDDGFDYSYNYDPQVASDELGLPIDLIEEFIQDFIAQAKEFKDELYSSLDEGDIDNVKILSHKLKGVAANLRIEDAFNTLSIINTSSDITEVGKYLNIFYKIIAKLSGEEIQVTQPTPTQEIETKPAEDETIEIAEDDDIFGDDLLVDFKEDEPEVKEEVSSTPKEEDDEDDLYLDFDEGIKDSEVPQKIEIPELADDDFLNDNEETIDIDDLLSVEQKTEEVDEMAIDFDELEELNIEDSAIEEAEVLDIEYSKELIANEIGLDQESFDEIFEDYIQDSQSCANTIRKAVIEGDLTKCKKEALKLKGMSDNMRVHAFKEELASLTSSTDEDVLLKALTKIDAVIAQISK